MSGCTLPIAASQPDASDKLAALAAPLAAHTQPGVLTRVAYNVILDIGRGHLPVRANLVFREGQENNLGRHVTPPTDGEVLAPDWLGAPEGTHAGDVFTLSAKNNKGVVIWTHTVNVVDTYPLVPTRPEPAYWCGLRNLFRSQTGDPADLPLAALMTTSEEVRTRYSELRRVGAATQPERFEPSRRSGPGHSSSTISRTRHAESSSPPRSCERPCPSVATPCGWSWVMPRPRPPWSPARWHRCDWSVCSPRLPCSSRQPPCSPVNSNAR